MGFAPWTGATRCTDGATPGARALMAWVLANTAGARSLGIYNCRTVRGGSTTSTHGEGRALDIAMPMSSGRGSPAGRRLVALLAKDAAKLGIQALIYDRTIWSAKSPSGRRYTGVHPHYDHVHVELTRTAGAKLTKATISSVLSGTSSKRPKVSLRNIRAAARTDPAAEQGKASHAADVRIVEAALRAEKLLGSRYGKDGAFGTATIAAYSSWQRSLGYSGADADGIPGRASLTKLGDKHGFDVK